MHGYKWPINCTRTRTLGAAVLQLAAAEAVGASAKVVAQALRGGITTFSSLQMRSRHGPQHRLSGIAVGLSTRAAVMQAIYIVW